MLIEASKVRICALTCWWRRERKLVDINAADLSGCDVGLDAEQGFWLEEWEKLAEYKSIGWGARAGQQDEHERSYDGTSVLHHCLFGSQSLISPVSSLFRSRFRF